MSNEIDTDEVLQIAKSVAQRYAARVFWANGHLTDMTSEASIAVLQAQKTWDPQVGVSFAKYARRAATLRVRDYLWRESSPASGGMHDPRKHIAGRRRTGLVGKPREGLADAGVGQVRGEVVPEELTVDGRSVIDQLDEYRRSMAVRGRLRDLCAHTRDGALAEQVLVDGRKPAHVIKESGRDVYGAVELVRRRARRDPALYELWQAGE